MCDTCGCGDTNIVSVDVHERLLARNDEVAAHLRAHFQEARRRTGGRYLMSYVLEARHLAVGAQDRELFDGLIAKVLEAESGALPRARLIYAAAKLKAAALKEKADDYF